MLDCVSNGVVADEPQPAVLVEISGVIKWFDASKGYGFIVRDDGKPDVLLHVSVLRRDGHQTAREGSQMVCEVVEGPKGWQVFRILSMDESAAITRERPTPRNARAVTPIDGIERMTCRWFSRTRGFGFLVRGDESEVFVHMETLKRSSFAELRPDQVVWARFGQGPKGLAAIEVHLHEQ